MPFPFTFSIAVPGLNPFSAPAETPSSPQSVPGPSQSPEKARARPTRPRNINERRPSPSPSPSAPVSRKRGWDPSLAEPSQSSATFTSSSGYLDTPAKYREMAGNQSRDEFELEDMTTTSGSDLPPPAKRRRGLAGSIISSAVGAAMISAAVGLTVYRLWRDRGKDPETEALPPPPPYQQGEWTPPLQQPPVEITPPTPMMTPRRRKVRHSNPVATGSRRHNQRARPRVHAARAFSPQAPGAMSPSNPLLSPEPTETHDPVAVEDQMDWMGEQLSMLIQEGQKALGREIVVQSDAREDEVDDGSGAWEEEEGGYDQEFGGAGPSRHRGSVSRSSSPRRIKRPRNLTLAPPSYTSRTPSASPHDTRFEFVSASLPSSTGARWNAPTDRGMSAEFEGRRTKREEETWESPELKESMARARERLLAARGAS
ncbi:hypothetical protein FB45DRAFT_887134 [Roridomyces roridus]|uniref:Uncharacterized protein n=1 Tax=Roridomyces roridus TaxID=1738132 RepID=A0AAD7CIV4_9AGAR|nr:hypothetical protein FB45DRAFT_887134 [Roridomyces roridus]